jgi:hypothetical protein
MMMSWWRSGREGRVDEGYRCRLSGRAVCGIERRFGRGVGRHFVALDTRLEPG